MSAFGARGSRVGRHDVKNAIVEGDNGVCEASLNALGGS